MSMTGRPPKPTRVKQLSGNPGRRPLNKREPKPASAVKRPRGLGKGAAKFWSEHAAELERLQLMTGVDVPAFRLMAEMYAIAVDAAAEVQAEGLTVASADGGLKKHPAFQVLRDSATSFRQFSHDFGLNPAARGRLQLPAEAEQLSLAELLFEAVNEHVDDATK